LLAVAHRCGTPRSERAPRGVGGGRSDHGSSERPTPAAKLPPLMSPTHTTQQCAGTTRAHTTCTCACACAQQAARCRPQFRPAQPTPTAMLPQRTAGRLRCAEHRENAGCHARFRPHHRQASEACAACRIAPRPMTLTVVLASRALGSWSARQRVRTSQQHTAQHAHTARGARLSRTPRPSRRSPCHAATYCGTGWW